MSGDAQWEAGSPSRHIEHLDAVVTASTARLEQAFQGLTMRVDMLESSVEDAMRALRDLQATVAAIPSATGVDPGTLDRWSGEQVDAVAGVEKQLAALTGQVEALRRRIPLRARDDQRGRDPWSIDQASVEAIARAVAHQIGAGPR